MNRGLVAVAMAGALCLGGAGAVSAGPSGPAGASTQSCTPGYSPCIPNKSSDVDCAAGSGNGPRYTKRGVVYHVKRGYDRYRLDADHDGLGCERR